LSETASAQTTASPTVTPGGSPGPLYRTAGLAALVAAFSYLVQPIVVFVVQPPTSGAGGYPTADDLMALRSLAPLELAVFTAIGVSTIVLSVAVFRLRTALGSPSTIPSILAAILGVIAGLGWIGAAAGTMSAYGLYATNIAEITGDSEIQQAVIQSALLGTGMLSVPVIAMTGWFALLGTSGRRAGIVGWPLAVVCFAAVVVIGAPALILLLPFGVLALIPVFAVLGVAFLAKSRRYA